MVRKRAKADENAGEIGHHFFRVTGITNHLQ
jgi:hypothetical protein